MTSSVGSLRWAGEAARAQRSVPPGQKAPIVAHSHLRWSFVWQRPQQTHSRLARERRVLFIEEPVAADAGEPHLRLSEPWPDVTVAQPILPGRPSAAETEAAVNGLLREAFAGPLGRRFGGAVHWLYTPLMEPQIDAAPEPAAIVYDCMDELSAFAFAPAGLAARERRLLERADVVFTGGWALYDAKRRLHANVHAFGCGVDFHHFRAAASSGEPPPDLAGSNRPRLGYVGVVDERLDYALLERIAEELQDALLVIIGPVVKVDPASLPSRPNILYLGARSYASLPSYLGAFDVCLMPFALNEATRFINPTKTLEYLATGKPVVSTPVPDVVRGFSGCVHVAPAGGIPALLRRVLAGERLDPRRGLEAARAASWERIVAEMERLATASLQGEGRTGERAADEVPA